MLLNFPRIDIFFCVEKKLDAQDSEENKVFGKKMRKGNNSKLFRTFVGVEKIKLLKMLPTCTKRLSCCYFVEKSLKLLQMLKTKTN